MSAMVVCPAVMHRLAHAAETVAKPLRLEQVGRHAGAGDGESGLEEVAGLGVDLRVTYQGLLVEVHPAKRRVVGVECVERALPQSTTGRVEEMRFSAWRCTVPCQIS